MLSIKGFTVRCNILLSDAYSDKTIKKPTRSEEVGWEAGCSGREHPAGAAAAVGTQGRGRGQRQPRSAPAIPQVPTTSPAVLKPGRLRKGQHGSTAPWL